MQTSNANHLGGTEKLQKENVIAKHFNSVTTTWVGRQTACMGSCAAPSEGTLGVSLEAADISSWAGSPEQLGRQWAQVAPCTYSSASRSWPRTRLGLSPLVMWGGLGFGDREGLGGLFRMRGRTTAAALWDRGCRGCQLVPPTAGARARGLRGGWAAVALEWRPSPCGLEGTMQC